VSAASNALMWKLRRQFEKTACFDELFRRRLQSPLQQCHKTASSRQASVVATVPKSLSMVQRNEMRVRVVGIIGT
jgi:hypothetical protein